MAGYDNDLLTGVGQFLAAQGHGVWNPDGVFVADQTGIVLDVMPDKPDNSIVLSAYGVSDDPSQTNNVTGLQVRTCAAGRRSTDVRDLTADVFNELHGREHLVLETGLHVVQILRRSFTSGGQDSAGRWSMIQNFYCDLYVPSMHAFAIEETP